MSEFDDWRDLEDGLGSLKKHMKSSKVKLDLDDVSEMFGKCESNWTALMSQYEEVVKENQALRYSLGVCDCKEATHHEYVTSTESNDEEPTFEANVYTGAEDVLLASLCLGKNILGALVHHFYGYDYTGETFHKNVNKLKVGDLTKLSRWDLENIYNIGPKKLDKILASMEALGISLIKEG